jgi:phosphoribosylamine--glycine ligase
VALSDGAGTHPPPHPALSAVDDPGDPPLFEDSCSEDSFTGAVDPLQAPASNTEGPNTGGMGSYSPVSDITESLIDWTTADVVIPVLDELKRRSIDYTGFLYVGLMLTDDGPQVLEFNSRLGDPETQAILPRLESDLLAALHAGAMGELSGHVFEWSSKVAVDVVLAAPGYPEDPEIGMAIIGVDMVSETIVFHAGTASTGTGLVTAGGRVLSVVGVCDTYVEAREEAYAAADLIQFRGSQYRTDIAEIETESPEIEEGGQP